MTEKFPQYKSYQIWLLAIRPKTLPAAAGPIIVGAGVALSQRQLPNEMVLPFLLCLLCSFLLQIGVNLANDYFDGKRGIDAGERKGPLRVTQSGLLSPQAVQKGMFISLFFAGILFCYLVYHGGIFIALIGVASLISAFAYSGGPYPIASHGLGEIFVFLFYGLVGVCGTYYIMLQTLSWQAFFASFPPGMLISAIMVVNNFRDIDSDKEVGKITLAVRLGRFMTIRLYSFLIFGSYLIPILFVFLGWGTPFVLLPLVTLWMGQRLVIQMKYTTGFDLNSHLARTAKFSLLFCVLFSCGLIFKF